MSKFKPLFIKIFLISGIIVFAPVVNAENNPNFGRDLRIWQKPPKFRYEDIKDTCHYSSETFRVQVELNNDKNGNISQATITKSSNNPKIDKMILKQVKKAQFFPFIHNGKPVKSIVNLPFVISCDEYSYELTYS